MRPNVIVQNLGCGPGQCAQPGVLELTQETLDRNAQCLGTLPNLQWRETVDVHVGKLFLDRLDHVDIEVAGEIGVNPTLKGYLGCPPSPCLT